MSTSDDEEIEEDNEAEGESRTNSRMIEASSNTESEDQDSDDNVTEDDRETVSEETNLRIQCEREEGNLIETKNKKKESDATQIIENVSEVTRNKRSSITLVKSDEDTNETEKLRNSPAKEHITVKTEPMEYSDDDGPPVLSPIIPLSVAQETEEHDDNYPNQMRHKLSPMVSLPIQTEKKKYMCELDEIRNEIERSKSTLFLNSMEYYENEKVDKGSNESVRALAGILESESEEDCEGRLSDNEDGELDEKDSHIEIVENNAELKVEFQQQFEGYNSVNTNEQLDTPKMEDSAEETFEENSEDEVEVDEENGVQIHNLNGTVLMVANDSDGNQILIQQNMSDIGNDDSNAEVTEYVYQEGNEYELEEYGITYPEEDVILQSGGIQEISDNIQDISEDNDNMEEDEEEEEEGMEEGDRSDEEIREEDHEEERNDEEENGSDLQVFNISAKSNVSRT